MRHLILVARTSLVLALGSVVLFSGCQQEEGFKCGQTIPGTSTIRTCDRGLEICVCSNNSCAKKVGVTIDERKALDAGATSVAGAAANDAEWGPCSGPGMTGYRYDEAPYADDAHAGQCVKTFELLLAGRVPSADLPGPGCPGQNPDAGTGGTSDGGGGSNAGGMSQGGMSEGGMSGGGGTGGDAGAGGLGGAGAGASGASLGGAGGTL